MKGTNGLDFDGQSSSIVSSVHTLAERYKGRPVAGILLFTDGNATDLMEGSPDLAGVPPVYPVVIGSEESAPDISIEQAHHSTNRV